METIIMVAQLVLGLSILVGLHEMGHLLAAKMFGMRVEKFSIGFPPKIWGIQIGETEYSIGALPLGGYVKIAGMIDESLDTDAMKLPPEPWEFRAKPAWQRLIVMLGGIIVNVITGVAIFISLVYIYGEPYLSKDAVNKHGIYVNEVGQKLGLQTGDKVVAINGKPFDNFSDVTNIGLLLEDQSSYSVERNGVRIEVPVPSDFLNQLSQMKGDDRFFIQSLTPFRVSLVSKGSPADHAGLLVGDKIVALNDSSIQYFQELKSLLGQHKNDSVVLGIDRYGKMLTLRAQVNGEGKLGFGIEDLTDQSTINYSIASAVPRGTVKAFEVISLQLKAFGKIFKGEISASESLSGPLGMAQVYGSVWNWYKFWSITAMLSMVLAFMNLLPIPALDGGHVVFLTYEIVSGRPPSDKFLENAQKVGMVLLLSLMVFAIGNDIYKWFR